MANKSLISFSYGIILMVHLCITGAGFDVTIFLNAQLPGIKTYIMNTNTILTSPVLDIIFEGRNKNYGAYMLRKYYAGRLWKSLLIMSALVALFFLCVMKPAKKTTGVEVNMMDDLRVTAVLHIKEVTQTKPLEKWVKPTRQQQFTSQFVTVKDNDEATELNNITNLQIGTHTSIQGNPGEVATIELPVEPVEEAPPIEPVIDINEPVLDPDVQASFPGGNMALLRFLEKNLASPEEISEAVQVRIKFVVGFDGNIEMLEVVESGGLAFNNEVIRVLKKMPRWNPGKKGGRNVRVYYYLPVKFQPVD